MDAVKEAFQKVKTDIKSLKEEIDSLKEQISELNSSLDTSLDKQTLRHKNPTLSTHTSTQNKGFNASKVQNSGVSIGNRGVPTDRQTDRQTDTSTHFQAENKQNSFSNALEALDSLDNIKKEIRLKFKRLTEQEVLVFSCLYQLTEERDFTNYKEISQKLSLSESSIRDYIGRLIKKGIPVDKKKLNNKNIQLSVSQDLIKIASLNTILELRNL